MQTKALVTAPDAQNTALEAAGAIKNRSAVYFTTCKEIALKSPSLNDLHSGLFRDSKEAKLERNLRKMTSPKDDPDGLRREIISAEIMNLIFDAARLLQFTPPEIDTVTTITDALFSDFPAMTMHEIYFVFNAIAKGEFRLGAEIIRLPGFYGKFTAFAVVDCFALFLEKRPISLQAAQLRLKSENRRATTAASPAPKAMDATVAELLCNIGRATSPAPAPKEPSEAERLEFVRTVLPALPNLTPEQLSALKFSLQKHPLILQQIASWEQLN